MKLSDLTAHYSPSYPEPYDWDQTLAYMLSDPDEAEVLRVLVNDLERDGKFREPIVLGLADYEDADKPAYVLNGTHRVVAHIILDSADVDVTYEFPKVDDNGGLIVTKVAFDKDELTGDMFDRVYEMLRSFPISDELWATSSVASSNGDVLEMAWDVYDYSIETINAINKRVTEKLSKHFPDNDYVVSTKVEHYDDPEPSDNDAHAGIFEDDE